MPKFRHYFSYEFAIESELEGSNDAEVNDILKKARDFLNLPEDKTNRLEWYNTEELEADIKVVAKCEDSLAMGYSPSYMELAIEPAQLELYKKVYNSCKGQKEIDYICLYSTPAYKLLDEEKDEFVIEGYTLRDDCTKIYSNGTMQVMFTVKHSTEEVWCEFDLVEVINAG